MPFSSERFNGRMLSYDGPRETEEMRELRAKIRDELREILRVVQSSYDPEELKRVLHTLEMRSPSVFRPDPDHELGRRQMRRSDEARLDRGVRSGPITSFEHLKSMTDRELTAMHNDYTAWLMGRADHHHMARPESRPTDQDLRAVEMEMRQRGLL